MYSDVLREKKYFHLHLSGRNVRKSECFVKTATDGDLEAVFWHFKMVNIIFPIFRVDYYSQRIELHIKIVII